MTPTLSCFSIVWQSILLSLKLACCCSGNTSGDMPSDTALIPDIDCRTAFRTEGTLYIAQLVTSQSISIQIGPALLKSWSLLDHSTPCSVRKGNSPRASVRIGQIEARY